MTKPNSTTGYENRWMELSLTIYEQEGLSIYSMQFRDLEARDRAIKRTLRSFLVESFLDELEEQNPIRFAGIERDHTLRIAASETNHVSFQEAKDLDRSTLEILVMSQFNHWKLPAHAYTVASAKAHDLPGGEMLLAPYRPN
ncbi:hypothetical protein NPJ88_003650 [Halomonas elongata]|uniref:hypothetical protein n=1 Tax=Halomonas elongata TaxID=2746 RepID=UPI00255B3DAB|nr:hypothetical protein [Halomonas elongata]MDL4861420.1 hypothetical protein [Halomonas elongata]